MTDLTFFIEKEGKKFLLLNYYYKFAEIIPESDKFNIPNNN